MAEVTLTDLEASIVAMRAMCAEAKRSSKRGSRMSGEAVEATLIPFVRWMTDRAKEASATNAPPGEFCADLIEATARAVANITANAAGCVSPTTGLPYERAASFIMIACVEALGSQVKNFDAAFLGRTTFVAGKQEPFDFRDHMKKET